MLSNAVGPETPEMLDFVTFRISTLHARLNAQGAHILRQHAGLSLNQWRIISLVQIFGPAVPSAEIIRKIGLDKGLFSRNLKTLVAQGYIASSPDSSDQRRQLLSLTDKGKRIYDKTILVMRKRQEALLEGISAAEKSALFATLAKLDKNARKPEIPSGDQNPMAAPSLRGSEPPA